MTADLIASMTRLAACVDTLDAAGATDAYADVQARLTAGEAEGAEVTRATLEELLADIAARQAVADAVAAITVATEKGDAAALETATTTAIAVMYEHADTLSARNEVTGDPVVDAALAAVRAVDDVVYAMEALPDPRLVDDLAAKAAELAVAADAALKGAAVIDYIPDAETIKLAALGG